MLNVSNEFWGVENIEAKHNCMIHNFEKKYFHSEQRYVTKIHVTVRFYAITFRCVNKG